MKKFSIKRVFTANSRFSKNFLSIASANFLSQLCLLAATPLLSRIYSPEDFGLAALFLSLLQVIASFSTWRFDRSIPNTSSKLAALLVSLCGVFMLVCVCTLTYIFVYFELNHLSVWPEVDTIGSVLYFLPIAIFFTGLIQLANGWFARESVMKAVGKSVVAYTGVYLAVSLLGGWLGLAATGLIVAAVLALFMRFSTLFYYIEWSFLKGRGSFYRFNLILKKYFWVSSVSSVVTLVNTFSLSAPVFLLSMIYGPAEVGIYALVFRVLGTPLGVLTKSLSLSFWSEAAELVRKNDFLRLRRIYLKVSGVLAIFSVVAGVGCVFGSLLIEDILGQDWVGAGPVMIALIPYIAGIAIVSPTNHLWVLNRHELQLIADGSRLALMVLSVYLAGLYDWSLSSTVLALSISSFIGHLSLFLIHIKLHREKFI